ncbi:MAG: response regulator [Kiritimatiellae bacterium]|nr:response regulator [Kiritimatiellia bacterium]
MSYRILVVDDEEEIRKALSRHFRYKGYEVETACDGRQALATLADAKVDVLISDIVMPGMSGVDLMRAVRREYPMVRVIMITGYINQENVLACMRHGAETCIFKPWTDMKELEQAVRKALRSLKIWKKKLRQLIDMKPD